MLKIGKLAIAGTIAGMTVVPHAYADVNADVADCRARAEVIAGGSEGRQTQNSLVRGAIGVVGAAIRGNGGAGYALERAAMGAAYGANSDGNRSARETSVEFKRCMRDKDVSLNR